MSSPNFRYISWRLFGSDEVKHGNLIIVEVSAEFMAPDETLLLGLVC